MSQSYSKESMDAGGQVLNKIFDAAEMAAKKYENHRASTNGSLVKLTSVSRVEPLCIVDSDCVHLDYITDVLNSLQSIFCGYYLQAVSLMGTVSGVQVAKELDRLNPNRDPKVSEFINATRDNLTSLPSRLDLMSYKWKLPKNNSNLSLEYSSSVKDERTAELIEKENAAGGFNYSNRELLSATEIANLSVGKLLNVSINKNNQIISVPIAFRLLVNELRPSTIVKIFGNGGLDKSFVERFYKWKAGRISFFKDLILCRDLIKEHRKALMDDKEGVFTEIQQRVNKNIIAGLINKQPSAATASNLYVISEATAAQIKRSSGYDVTNFTQRQALFEETYAMILVVVDRDYERVSFYHDGMRLPSTLSVRELRSTNKGTGPSIMDILAAYKQGQAPTL